MTETKVSQQLTALIMAGGKGSRLNPLTEIRAKPAMYFGGKYRIIDFVMSNCLNSHIKKISVITQYRSNSLIGHIFKSWSFLNQQSTIGYVDILPASQQHKDDMWYRGTADSVSQNLSFIKSRLTKYTLILAGDHIYKMDYSIMLEKHIKSKSPCSVGCVVVSKLEAKGFGVMAVDKSGVITDFIEKPEIPPTIPDNNESCLASMGIYLFNTDYLIDLLEQDFKTSDSSHDFGKDIIPKIVKKRDAYAHPFPESCVKTTPESVNYWKDVGTRDSYWSANMALLDPLPQFDLYDTNWPISTDQNNFQPCKFLYNNKDRIGYATDSLVSGNCIISGGHIDKSILCYGVRVNSYSKISQSILLPKVEIERNCRINKAVIEKGCHIPRGTVIGENPEEDKRRFDITRKGVIIITPSMLKKIQL